MQLSLTLESELVYYVQLASGEVFGPNQPIALKLLGSERSFQALEGMLPSIGNLAFAFA